MVHKTISLDERVGKMAEELQTLRMRVDQLSRLANLTELPEQAYNTIMDAPSAVANPAENESAPYEPTEISEEILTWAGKASLLPRMATLCFLLVVALILRTLTDSGLLNTLLGSAIGMSYAAALMFTGWYKYRKQSPLAPVFAACGVVLISTIVVETHMRFQSLPLVPAYFTLMLSGIGMAVISYQFNVLIPVSIGTLSMCLAGVAIDYPNPFFPYLAMILLTANWLGFYAARIQRCAWLRWILLVVTVAMLSMWSLKLGMALYSQQQPGAALALNWFLPVLGVFALSYLAGALFGILRSGNEPISRFDFSLPTINLVFLFIVACYVVGAWGKSIPALGIIGIVVAAGHLGMAFWLAKRKEAGSPGTNSFVFAAMMLLAFALPAVTGRLLFSLPLISGMALLIAYISHHWQNGAVRLTSYAFQAYACIALMFIMHGEGTGSLVLINAAPASIMAALSIAHYLWCRRQLPPENARFFVRFDEKDISAVILVLAALVYSFFALRVVAFHSLQAMGGDVRSAFSSVQSVLINGSAIGMMAIALLRRNKEIRNVAILVTLVGAIKVFLFDLMGIHGVPLVASVFSFGLAAALESVGLGRWQKFTAEEPDQEPELSSSEG